MCSVCAEFERIVAIVLDKTDREHASRRKRKQGDSEQDAQIEATAAELLNTRRESQSQASPNVAPSPQQQPPQQEGLIFNPDFHGFNEVRKFLSYILIQSLLEANSHSHSRSHLTLHTPLYKPMRQHANMDHLV